MCTIYFPGLATLGEDPNITQTIEKAVRQCLRQLELLQTVWMDVLPATVYCKSVGKMQFHDIVCSMPCCVILQFSAAAGLPTYWLATICWVVKADN
jgi:hypothetical protein